jgi:transposase-like protein
MKTIKQIADEIGVSKTAIMKKIDNLGLRSSLRKIANQFAIDETQESFIIKAFEVNSQTDNANQSQTEPQTGWQFSLRLLEQEIEFLRTQLNEKDEQLKRLDARLAEAQILHADTKNMPLLAASLELTVPPLSFRTRFKNAIRAIKGEIGGHT